jgi:4-amino-4-deoxy-L-arabinose transferase-like glycosyltransferase
MRRSRLTPPARPRYFLPGAVLILLAAFFLRLWQQGTSSLWIDEIFTDFYTGLPLARFFEVRRSNPENMPLFFFLMRFVPTHNDVMIRLPLLLLGMLDIALVIQIARRLYGRNDLALVAGALFATNPYNIWLGRNARLYMLLLAETLLASYFFLALLQGRRSRANWLAFILASMAAYNTHYFALALPAAQYMVLFLTRRGGLRLYRRWVGAQVVALIPFGVWVFSVLQKKELSLGTNWIPSSSLVDIPISITNLGVGHDGVVTWYFIPALIALAVGLAMGVFYALRERRSAPADFYWLWVVSIVIFPVFLVSRVKPLYVDRYMIVALPGVIFLMQRGWSRLPRRASCGALAAVVIVTGTVHATRMITSGGYIRQDWRAAADYIHARFQPGDGFMGDAPLNLLCIERYYDDEDVFELAYDVLPEDAPPPPVDRLWVLYMDPVVNIHRQGKMPGFDPFAPGQTAIGDWLIARRDQVIDLREFNGVTVLLVDMRR